MTKLITKTSGIKPSYMVPEGVFYCRFHSHDTGPDGEGVVKLRMRYEMDVPDSKGIPFLAAMNLDPILVEGSELYWHLKPWIGEVRLREFMESGANFDTLIGTPGIGTIKHLDNGRPKPYVWLKSVVPVGFHSDAVMTKLPKPLITTTDTRTTNQSGATTLADHGTLTANASICKYCGSEIGRFSKVQ